MMYPHVYLYRTSVDCLYVPTLGRGGVTCSLTVGVYQALLELLCPTSTQVRCQVLFAFVVFCEKKKNRKTKLCEVILISFFHFIYYFSGPLKSLLFFFFLWKASSVWSFVSSRILGWNFCCSEKPEPEDFISIEGLWILYKNLFSFFFLGKKYDIYTFLLSL